MLKYKKTKKGGLQITVPEWVVSDCNVDLDIPLKFGVVSANGVFVITSSVDFEAYLKLSETKRKAYESGVMKDLFHIGNM